jgi:hypothetical protein
MRVILSILALFLMAGCGVPSPPKPSPYRYITQDRAEARNPCCPISIHP